MGNDHRKVCISGMHCTVPPVHLNQKESVRYMTARYESVLSPRSFRVMQKVFEHPSVETRHFAVTDPVQILHESKDEQIHRFTEWSVRLSCEAIRGAIQRSGRSLAEIRALVVNTCTSYICPGVSTYVLEALDLDPTVQCFDLVGAGCGGAIPNIQAANALARGFDHGIVVSVAVEICTATFRMADDLSLIISNAIFGDGAAAVVLEPATAGLAIIDSESTLAPHLREHIRYTYKDGQLYNQLTRELPGHAASTVEQSVSNLLTRNNLKMQDIRHWAFHPGGDKVISAVADRLNLPETAMAPTRGVLRDYGNMSSPTTLFVLDRILQSAPVEPGENIIIVGFGAGMSAHAMLLRQH